jgi:hypothetical protein
VLDDALGECAGLDADPVADEADGVGVGVGFGEAVFVGRAEWLPLGVGRTLAVPL